MSPPRLNDLALLDTLRAKGVVVHAPAAVVVSDLDPDRIEAGVELFPGVTLCGRRTLLRAGTRLGMAGGGYYEDIATGRDVTLYSGVFQDAVFLEGVTMRGHAEVRGGTLLEEHCEAAHHVGYKMTVAMPFSVVGSLINFCDVLISGGRGRSDHTEVGSTLALYNFTPWGDKFASMLGSAVDGVFLRSDRIFIGGQTQIVSPIEVGFGAVLASGCAARRDIPAHTLGGDAPLTPPPNAPPFDPRRYGALGQKLHHSAHFVAQLRALHRWYSRLRLPLSAADPLQRALYEAAQRQLRAGIGERVARLDALMGRLPVSLALHAADVARASALDAGRAARAEARVEEHTRALEGWPEIRALLTSPIPDADLDPDVPPPADGLGALARDALEQQRAEASFRYLRWLTDPARDPLIAAARAQLQATVDAVMGPVCAWLRWGTPSEG